MGIDLRSRTRELKARGRAVAIREGKERGAGGWIADRQREGLGAAAIGIGIVDREEAEALAKTGTDRAGRTAGGVIQNWITDRTDDKSACHWSSLGAHDSGAIVQSQSHLDQTGGARLQRDRRIGQQGIELGQGAGHQPVRGTVDHERGAAAMGASAEASQAGVDHRQAQLGGGAVIGQIQIGHADWRCPNQALQACGHPVA